MIKFVFLFFLTLISINNSVCKELTVEEKFIEFDTTLEVLDELTKVFVSPEYVFIDRKYMKYSLYRSLILNSFYLESQSIGKLTSKIFCSKSLHDMEKLLKWKISMKFSKLDLKKSNIICESEINNSKLVMEQYFLNVKFVDAYLEYYYYLKDKSDTEPLFLNTLLKGSIRSIPSVKISELLIENQKKIEEKYKNKYINNEFYGVWNAAVLAAMQGSNIGFEAMRKVLKNDQTATSFINLIISINNKRKAKA
jgi:hypothetical protein